MSCIFEERHSVGLVRHHIDFKRALGGIDLLTHHLSPFVESVAVCRNVDALRCAVFHHHRESCVGEGMLNDHGRIGSFVDVGVKQCSCHCLNTVQIGFFPIYHILSHIPPIVIPGSSICRRSWMFETSLFLMSGPVMKPIHSWLLLSGTLWW